MHVWDAEGIAIDGVGVSPFVNAMRDFIKTRLPVQQPHSDKSESTLTFSIFVYTNWRGERDDDIDKKNEQMFENPSQEFRLKIEKLLGPLIQLRAASVPSNSNSYDYWLKGTATPELRGLKVGEVASLLELAQVLPPSGTTPLLDSSHQSLSNPNLARRTSVNSEHSQIGESVPKHAMLPRQSTSSSNTNSKQVLGNSVSSSVMSSQQASAKAFADTANAKENTNWVIILIIPEIFQIQSRY